MDSPLTRQLGLPEMACLFGATEKDLRRHCAELLDAPLAYRLLQGAERDAVLLDILKKIHKTDTLASGESRQPDWDSGWRENLLEYQATGDLSALVPKYFRKNVPARLGGDWVLGLDPDFVFKVTDIFRRWLFASTLSGLEEIHEFGCGPASHLALLAELFPGTRLHGYDWASSSQEIIAALREKNDWNISGKRFDFFNPDQDIRFAPASGVLTFGALEQVHDRHGPFVDFLLERAPGIVVNVECIHDFYTMDTISDYLALLYHRRRRYLEGYLARLHSLEAEGRLRILKSFHHRFGNQYNDTLSYVIWKPQPTGGKT